MKHQIILDQIVTAWQGSSRILLTGAANFDGDALGCLLALAHFGRAQGKHMVIANEKPASCLFQFATGDEPILQDLAGQVFDLIVICDTGSFDMLGSIYSDHKEIFENTQTINIDHHGSCYGNICWSTSGHEFASATMMVGDFIREIDPTGITPYMATTLLL